MGCCFSSSTNSGGPTLRRKPQAAVSDRAPPPCLEQEYVKEVLSSETHLPNLHRQVSGRRDLTQKAAAVSEVKIEAEQRIEEAEEVSCSQVSEMCSVSEVSRSQVSEMCSVSESFSTATTFTEKKDDEVNSKPTAGSAQRVARKRVYKERVPKSAATLTDPPPEKKFPAGKRSTRAAAQPRTRPQNATYGGVRRDPGEASGRRSRSPATRDPGGAGRRAAGRIPTGRAGSRSQSTTQSKEESRNDAVSHPNGNESLDNPHVSLECFIFL